MGSNISDFGANTDLGSIRNCTKIESNLLALYPWYDTFSFITSGVLTVFFVVLGLLGNLGSIVFVRRSSLHVHDFAATLTCISFWDTVVLCSALTCYGVEAFARYCSTEDYPKLIYWAVASLPISGIAYTASAWFYGAITIQRWLAIIQPVFPKFTRTLSGLAKATRWHKLRRFRVAIFVSLAAVAFKFPMFFEVIAVKCFDRDRNSVSAEVQPTPLRLSFKYQVLYRAVADLICTSVGPVLLIFAFTCGILKKLQIAYHNQNLARFRRRSVVAARDARKELFTTVILVVLMVKFLLCRTLPCVIDVWEAAFRYKRDDIVFQCVVEISNLLVLIGSSTNFLVYTFGRKILRSQRIFVRLRNKHRRRLSGFSAEELMRLDFSWLDIWCQKQTPNLGAQMVLNLAETNLDMQEKLDLDPGAPEQWENSAIVQVRGEQIAEFFYDIIQKLKTRERIGWDIEARERIQDIKDIHEHHGILLTKEHWRMVKKCIMRASRRYDATFHDKQETARVWGKLVKFCQAEALRN